MNTEFFIAKRLALRSTDAQNLSQLMVKVAAFSIALGMAVMIISIAVVTGFRSEIEAKMIGFGGHLQITNNDSNVSYENTPISRKLDTLPQLLALEGVKHIQPYVNKGAIIATDTDNQGVLLKGVDRDYDWAYFSSCLAEGHCPNYADSTVSNDILISQRLCKLLKLKQGDKIDVFFAQEPVRRRKFTIAGIFDTQLQEVDEQLVLCDMRHLQKINDWTPDQITGFELNIVNIDQLDSLQAKVNDMVAYKIHKDGSQLKVSSIKEHFAHLFSWLEVLDTNVWVILWLTILVAGFNMISGLLIMLLEKAGMIGVLKALGMRNGQLQKVFIYRSGFVVLKGMIAGNVIGIGLCLLQKYFALIPLDPDSYFVATVPINLQWTHIVLLNIGAYALILTALVIPSLVISKLTPDKSIRFE